MKYLLIGCLTCFCLFSSLNANAEVAVIVHPSNTSELDEKSIARIFTGKLKSYPNGGPILAMSLSSGNQATQEFNEKVLKRTDSQLKAYWSKLVFTGKGSPPASLDSPAEILQMVASNPNVISFVDATAVTGDVRVVATF